MVQYDQYGVPYTSYTPMMASEGGSANESSSIESTTPHSPPDLSIYNPTNWVPAPAPGAAGTDPAYQAYQQYYPQYYQTPYYNNYAIMMENSTLPSSAGESPNEDRSEGEDPASTPNTATTTNSPKKENDKENEKLIPGKMFVYFLSNICLLLQISNWFHLLITIFVVFFLKFL